MLMRSQCAVQMSAAEYDAASPDPVAPFSRPIASHMNADHADSTAAMVRHLTFAYGVMLCNASLRNRLFTVQAVHACSR